MKMTVNLTVEEVEDILKEAVQARFGDKAEVVRVISKTGKRWEGVGQMESQVLKYTGADVEVELK